MMFRAEGTNTKANTTKIYSFACKKTDTAILFDMDGVLVDVTNSYRKAIQETVGYFTGKKAQLEEIQDFKQKGGFNNDWDLTEAIIKSRGKTPNKTEIINKFQEYYLGNKGKKGLIENEQWLLPVDLLRQLSSKYNLGIVTGRPMEEALYVLRKFKVEKLFDVIIAMENYPAEKAKPNPYPINLALKKLGKTEGIYIGDSVDDITAAKSAGIRAIGCIPPGISDNALKDLLLKLGAERVLTNIAEIKFLVD